MAQSTDKIRNVALVGHGGSGKTSLAEAILFATGASQRLGSVDDGHSNLDYDPEEVKRKVSVNLALAPVEHKGHKVNIIDTPGYADFAGDAVSGMWAAETALFVVDAVAGPQVQTERLWETAENLRMPRAFFVNRLDKEHADFDATLAALQDAFGSRVGAVQIPIGQMHDLKGVVDVIRMEAYVKEGESIKVVDIPEDLRGAAEEAREVLAESVAEADDELMEKYLEGEQLTQEDIERLLGIAIAEQLFFPVFCGSATAMIGIRDLLDEIVGFFPDPTKHPAFVDADGEEHVVSPDGPMSAYVFKTMSDPYIGRLNFVKVVSGVLKPDSQVVNVRTRNKERVAHVYGMRGKDTFDVDGAAGGDIAVLAKLDTVITCDTLADSEIAPYEAMPFPKPLYSVAIRAKTRQDEDKLGGALNKIVEEEPTLHLRRDPETKQTVLSGLGEIQIDVALSRLKEKYHVEAETTDLRIPYRETIRAASQAQGKHKKQTGGHGQYGDCWVKLEPNPGGGFEFVDAITGGVIPRQFIPAVEKGIVEAMEKGILAGYPVVDVKATVYDGSYHSVDSSEMAFKVAGALAFKNAAENAKPVLLEPIANLEIKVPEEYAGDVMGDLSARRGKILGMEPAGKYQLIKAEVPYAEVVTYSVQLRSITSGAGTYTLELGQYAEVPGDIAKKIIEASQREEEE
ncbi:MAG: elongation factor G [Coriobacteriia bacterium]